MCKNVVGLELLAALSVIKTKHLAHQISVHPYFLPFIRRIMMFYTNWFWRAQAGMELILWAAYDFY